MSYNTDLQNNNTSLQEILVTVNALPEAGSSSGSGAEIETCTVNIINNSPDSLQYTVAYTNDSNIAVSKNSEPISYGETIELKTLSNSIIYFSLTDTPQLNITFTGNYQELVQGSGVYDRIFTPIGNTTITIINLGGH